MTNRSLIVFGARGFGQEVYQYAVDTLIAGMRLQPAGFADDKVGSSAEQIGSEVSWHSIDELSYIQDSDCVIAVRDPAARRAISARLVSMGHSPFSVVHPTAWISHNASIGIGAVIAPFASINHTGVLGANSALNAYASIGHDAGAEDHCVIPPHATLNGGAQLGERGFLGSHASLLLGSVIGSSSKVSARVAVQENAPPGSLVVDAKAKHRVILAVEG
ncbi:MAG: hypothetical protein HQ526_00535 [Actinobacteria bacterium]|nr:hypothetical protein [Actinomycetota bacterium]